MTIATINSASRMYDNLQRATTQRANVQQEIREMHTRIHSWGEKIQEDRKELRHAETHLERIRHHKKHLLHLTDTIQGNYTTGITWDGDEIHGTPDELIYFLEFVEQNAVERVTQRKQILKMSTETQDMLNDTRRTMEERRDEIEKLIKIRKEMYEFWWDNAGTFARAGLLAWHSTRNWRKWMATA